MKVKNLIQKLQTLDGELEVTTTNNNGLFTSVDDVALQEWGGVYASATLVLGRYDNSKCIVESKKSSETYVDEDFIDNVNRNLRSYNERIDKTEAMEANNVFKKDFAVLQKTFKKWYAENYDMIKEETMKELIGYPTKIELLSLNELENALSDSNLYRDVNPEYRKYLLESLLEEKLDDEIKNKISKKAEEIFKYILN